MKAVHAFLALALAILLVGSADGFILHGGGTIPATPPVLLTTLKIVNTSGSTQATNFITPIFGQAFKKGDVTTAPVFRLTDGTTLVPFSMSSPTQWTDGSIKWAAFMLRVPTTIAGNGSLTINIYSGGSAPSNSSRTLSDFAASGLDLNQQVVGLDNLSGTWTSDLNQGISARGADYKFMDGAAGAVWRVPAAFRQSAADHGQLEGWWYVSALQDVSGNLAGIRYLVGTTQPYYNVSSPVATYRSFSSLGIYNGASLVKDMWGSHGSGQTFTWSSGTTLTATGNGFQTGWLLRLTTTGSLPTGLSTGTSYFADSLTANTFAAGTDSSAVVQGSTLITPSGAGSGTQTATAYPYVTQFGTIYSASSSGTWDYIQGGGSIATDATVRVVPNNLYLRSTHLIPSFAFETYTAASNSATTYFPMTAGPVTRYFEQTGEREDIGPLTSWAARYLFTGAAVDETVLRTVALVGAELPVRLRDATTHAIPVGNNTTYTGMPAANANFRWYGSTSNLSGFTVPSNNFCYVAGFSTPDGSHRPDFTYIAALITGEPELVDQLADFANLSVISRYAGVGTASVGAVTNIGGAAGGSRNFIISGTNYYGVVLNGGNLMRIDAWDFRDVTAAAAFTLPEKAVENTYIADLMQGTLDAEAAYQALLPIYVTTNGIWNETDNSDGGVADAWANGYYINAMTLASARTENASALTFLNYIVKNSKHVHDIWGTAYIPYYEAIIRQSTNTHTSPFITSDNGWAFYTDSTLSWNSGTGLFTINTSPVPGLTMGNGDTIIFSDQAQTPPGGFSGETQYFVVNKSGSTLQLSATLGGSPITITNTSSTGHVYLYSSSLVAPNNITTNSIGSGYLANITASLNYAKSSGATVDATLLSDLTTDLQAQAGYTAAFQADPKYAVQATP